MTNPIAMALVLDMANQEFHALDHEKFMDLAIHEAQLAQARGEVPIGAAIVTLSGDIVATAGNTKEGQFDPAGHAEIEAIRKASQHLGRWRLNDCVLYVTLEPCLMCSGAAISARLAGVVFGTSDPKGGAVETLYQTLADPRLNHRCLVLSGIRQSKCAELLTDFFKMKRSQNEK